MTQLEFDFGTETWVPKQTSGNDPKVQDEQTDDATGISTADECETVPHRAYSLERSYEDNERLERESDWR